MAARRPGLTLEEGSWPVSRRHICSLAILLLPLAGSASAGAWLRADGTTFMSISHEQDLAGSTYTGLYAERGIGGRNTLGFRLDHSGSGQTGALIWLQRSLDDGSGPNRWTVSLGLGAVDRGGSLLPAGEVAAAWGRGIASPLGGGWFTVETRLNVVGEPEDTAATDDATREARYLGNLATQTAIKTDVTLGVHVTPSMVVINQIRFEQAEDTGFSSKLSTSLVRDLKGPAKLELGIMAPLSEQGEPALKVGTWLEF